MRASRNWLRVAAAAGVAALGLSACTSPEGPDPDLEGEVWIGTSPVDGTGFVEADDGDDAELVPGAQSGFHVWINVRVKGAAGRLVVSREARRASDGALILAANRQALEVPESAMDDWWENPLASPSFMCPSPIGIRVFDEQVLFSVRVYDGDGEDAALLAEDDLILVPRCPTGEQSAFCYEICAG